jgi:hypothetical protein
MLAGVPRKKTQSIVDFSQRDAILNVVANTQDRFTLLKGRYLAHIKAKETEIEDLRTKVKLLDEIDAEAQKLLTLDASDSSLKGKKMIAAALEAVQTIGNNGGITSGDVVDYMKNHGFEFTGEHYRVSLGVALKRLVDKKAISGRQDDGVHWKFTAAKP